MRKVENSMFTIDRRLNKLDSLIGARKQFVRQAGLTSQMRFDRRHGVRERTFQHTALLCEDGGCAMVCQCNCRNNALI